MGKWGAKLYDNDVAYDVKGIYKDMLSVGIVEEKIINHLSSYPNIKINSSKYCIPHILNISLMDIKPETFIHALDEENIFISTKSACSSTNTMSDSVYAVTKDRDKAMHSLRITLSHLTTKEEINTFLKVFDICYKKLNLKG